MDNRQGMAAGILVCLSMTACALTGPALAQTAATAAASPAADSATDAAKFIHDALLHDGHGDSAEFSSQGDLAWLSGIVLTHGDVTFTQAGGHSVNFPLRDLKLVYREDFLGNKELLVGGGTNSIVFTDAYSRATIQRIAADFAVLSRAAETPETAPAAPKPATAESAVIAPGPVGHAGTRLAVRVVQQCETNPSAASFLLDQDEDDCSAPVLESIRAKLSSAFSRNGVATGENGSNADTILTVTMTKRRLDTGAGGFLGDFTAKAVTAANYTLASSTGNTLTGGTVSDEDSDDGDGEDALELKFANKLVAEVMPRLPAGQSAQAGPPPRFGIGMGDLAPALAEGLGHPGLTGVQVFQVIATSPAGKAGIQAGDIIYEFDGRAIPNKEGLAATIAAEPQGKTVSAKLLRGKQDLDIQVQF